MSIMFGSISYLPTDGGQILDSGQKKSTVEENNLLRQKRRAVHLGQVDWMNKYLPNAFKRVIYQGWRPEDFTPEQQSISAKCFDTGIGMCRARNMILEEFYASAHDWLMLCDDDAWLYDHYDPSLFLRDLESGMFDYLGGAILPVQPTVMPFKKLNYTEQVRDNYLFTKAQLQVGVQVIFIPNAVKNGFKGVYFDEPFYNRVKYSEDALFCHDWVTAGYPLYCCTTIIMRMDAYNDSSILGLRKHSVEARKLFTDPGKRALCEHSTFELVEKKDGNLIVSSRNVRNITPSKTLVPRKEPLVFKSTEIPKGAPPLTSKRKLF